MKIINNITQKKYYIFCLLLLYFFITSVILCPGSNSESIIQDELVIPILTYHKFCIGESPDAYTINISHFEKQLKFLKENDYQVISLSQLIQCIESKHFPYKPVILTIDDGFKSVYTLAFPVLKKYNFPAILFLYTNFINHGPNQLSWQEIKEMIDGGMEVGSHSVSHCNLLNRRKYKSQEEYIRRIKKEIFNSKNILEKNINRKVHSFAYPYGVYSQQVQLLAKQAGYQALFNVNSMNNTMPIDTYSLNRQIIPAGYSLEKFQAILKEKPLQVNNIFPDDGTVTSNQEEKIGAIVNDPNITPGSLCFRLSGSGLLDYNYSHESKEVSFTPIAPKLLQKRTWIAQISAVDKNSGNRRKVSWLFTVK